jgi:ADP-ribose pyrophosphatase YjhB (NUDIX family)
MQWKPNVVVAAIIEREGRYLVVEETDDEGRLVINQPAGHLDHGETLIDAVKRETLEETGWHFEPQGIVGLYLLPKPESDITYFRICFHGTALRHDPASPLDHGIVRICWYTRAELLERKDMLRSALVITCIDDYLRGQRYPLDILHYITSPDHVC